MERTETAHGGNEPLGKGLAVRLNSCGAEASSIYLLQLEAAHDGTSLSECVSIFRPKLGENWILKLEHKVPL